MGFTSTDRETVYSWLALLTFAIYLAVFNFSIIYTWKKLSGPGMSKQVRNLVLIRHILTSVLYFLFNIYIFASPILVLAGNTDFTDYELDVWWTRLLKILFASQGFVIPLSRLSEPYFFEILGRKLKKFWGKNDASIDCENASNDEEFVERANRFSRNLTLYRESRGSLQHGN